MLAWVRLSLPFDDTCVERVREELVDRALRERPSANATALLRPEAPRVGRNLPNLTNWIRASEHQLPHSAHQEEAFRILDDGFCRLIVQIADGRQVRAPAVLSLGPVSAADVCRIRRSIRRTRSRTPPEPSSTSLRWGVAATASRSSIRSFAKTYILGRDEPSRGASGFPTRTWAQPTQSSDRPLATAQGRRLLNRLEQAVSNGGRQLSKLLLVNNDYLSRKSLNTLRDCTHVTMLG